MLLILLLTLEILLLYAEPAHATGIEVAAVAAAAAAAIGGIVSTVSAVEASKQQADAAEYEAEQRTVNAEAERAATERKNNRILAQRRAVGAATGVSQNEGSALSVMLDQIGEAEMEEINISRGAQQFGNVRRYEAKASRGRIGSQVVGGVANTTSSVLGSMASYGRMGAFKK